jgi:hypothetical protein
MNKVAMVASVGALLIGALPARAIPIAVGGASLAVAEADPVGGAVADTMSPGFVGGAGPNQFTGVLESKVISGDTSNPYGGLTFVYRVSNTSINNVDIHRLTVEGFESFLTDVSYQIGGQAPSAFDRSGGSGDVLGFDFAALLGADLDPGEVSSWLVVQTDAEEYKTAQANVIDGSVSTSSVFAPTGEPIPPEATPDGGATAMMLGLGVVCLGLLRPRKS